jgi:hypothetical protein
MIASLALERARDETGAPLFLIKGGVMIELRLGLRARATRDLDAVFRAEFHSWLDQLDGANFSTFERNRDTKEWIELPVAQLIADGDDVTISRPHADWISPDLAIIDPATTERITRAEGASGSDARWRSRKSDV